MAEGETEGRGREGGRERQQTLTHTSYEAISFRLRAVLRVSVLFIFVRFDQISKEIVKIFIEMI